MSLDTGRRLRRAATAGVAAVTAVVDRSSGASTIARVSLGAMVLLAGVHKLVAPTAWTAYVTDWLAPWLVVSPLTFMLVNGVLEVGFGLALLADRYTLFASLVAAVSLSATCLYLAVVFVVEGGLFGDVLVRDVGLAGLAWAVVVDAVETRSAT
ncbi:DoxX family membrane protein [Halogeometricum limi]|uniref:DoxX protein n=1 Tax=Halogeometricum limi TaxID=555875 RepID=A0A1I6GIM1_9EURY|nr:DoxX family membrane protein [Halogeometricum limi]SFR41917.1 DoxX protein [Halogeometricum limi]